jgi:hypothetical protein
MTIQMTGTRSAGIYIKPNSRRDLMQHVSLEHDIFDDNTNPHSRQLWRRPACRPVGVDQQQHNTDGSSPRSAS